LYMKFHPTLRLLTFHSYNIYIRYFVFLFLCIWYILSSTSISTISFDNLLNNIRQRTHRMYIAWRHKKKILKKNFNVWTCIRAFNSIEITLLQFALIHILASYMHFSIFFVFFFFFFYRLLPVILVMLLFVVQEHVCMVQIDDWMITQI